MGILYNLGYTYCDKCGKTIKKISHYYGTQLLSEINLQLKTGAICENCYRQYLIRSLDKIGINVLDKNGNYKNFSDVLQEFQDVWSKQIDGG